MPSVAAVLVDQKARRSAEAEVEADLTSEVVRAVMVVVAGSGAVCQAVEIVERPGAEMARVEGWGGGVGICG
jgi:hypothetical protein